MEDLKNKTGEELFEYYMNEDKSIIHDLIVYLPLLMDDKKLYSLLREFAEKTKTLKAVYSGFGDKVESGDEYLGSIEDGELYLTSRD